MKHDQQREFLATVFWVLVATAGIAVWALVTAAHLRPFLAVKAAAGLP